VLLPITISILFTYNNFAILACTGLVLDCELLYELVDAQVVAGVVGVGCLRLRGCLVAAMV